MSTYSRLMAAVAGLSIAIFTVAFSPIAVAQERTSAEFTFGILSDLGYAPAQEPLLENVFAELNRTSLAFVVHLGDLGSPANGSCADELWARRLTQFCASANPIIYTPGDGKHDPEIILGGSVTLLGQRARKQQGGCVVSLRMGGSSILKRAGMGDPAATRQHQSDL
jgi:hypothetical protein